MKIGIAYTAYNRPLVLAESVSKMMQFFPPDAELVIVDDGSQYPSTHTFRFEKNQGIAAAKNKCLELLEEKGCDHFFLFDDDTYPIAPDWWVPYVESNEHHLMYQFKVPGKPSTDMEEIYRNKKIVSYTHTRGAMIYVDSAVLIEVGGFDTAYGQYGFEHPDYTNRIHNGGLTTHRAMDVVNSHELLYCLDQDGAVKSSVSEVTRRSKKNYPLYVKSKTSKAFKEYK